MKRFTFLFAPDDGNGGGGGGTLLGGDGGGQQQQGGDQGQQQHQQQQQSGAWDFRSVLDESGAFKQGWHEALPDDLKPYSATLAKYPNATELLRGLGNAQKLIGQRGSQEVKPPGPDATPEQKAAWNKLIGVPDTPDGYGIQKPDKLPEGIEWSDEQAKAFQAKAHELGLNPQQVQALIAYDIERQAAGAQKVAAEIQAFVAAQKADLEKEWGSSFGNNVEKAKAAAQVLGLDPNDPELGNSAKVIKALFAASQLISEDKFVASNKVGLGLTGEDQAEDIRRNPNNPWHNAYMGKEGKERQQQAASLIMRLSGVRPE